MKAARVQSNGKRQPKPPTATIAGRPVALPEVVFRKHRTPMALLRAYFKPMGVRPEDIQETGEMLADMERHGVWAFAATRESPPVIHFWHKLDVDSLQLAAVLGHEVGHVSGRPLRSRRNDWREELRANEYAAATYLALRQVLGRR